VRHTHLAAQVKKTKELLVVVERHASNRPAHICIGYDRVWHVILAEVLPLCTGVWALSKVVGHNTGIIVDIDLPSGLLSSIFDYRTVAAVGQEAADGLVLVGWVAAGPRVISNKVAVWRLAAVRQVPSQQSVLFGRVAVELAAVGNVVAAGPVIAG